MSDGRLLTAADDEVHVWDLTKAEKISAGITLLLSALFIYLTLPSRRMKMIVTMLMIILILVITSVNYFLTSVGYRFTPLSEELSAFGGPRNESKKVVSSVSSLL